MEIKESIQFIYTWVDEKGSECKTTFQQSWDGLTKEHPDSAYLHDQLQAFLTCVGINKENNDA